MDDDMMFLFWRWRTVEALKKIGSKLGKQWDFTVDPCSGTSGWVDHTTDEDSMRAANVTCGNCNATYCHITSIILKRQNLTGSLPDELANLTSLQSIILTRNYLGGTIPVAWKSLPLITLSLQGNRISGSIPEELGNITTLNELVLDDNLLQGSIPSSIGKLRNLERLLLTANNLTGGLPKTLGNLKNLTQFRLDSNPISGKIPSFIVNWSKIQLLVLRNLSISGELPDYIGGMAYLKFFDISYNSFNGSNAPPDCHRGSNLNVVSSYSSTNDNKFAPCLRRNNPCPGIAKYYNLFINCGGPAWTIGEDEYQGNTDTEGPSYYNSYNDKWAYSSTGSFVHNDNEPFLATNVSVLNMSNPELYMTARLSPLSLKYYGLCLQNGNYTGKKVLRDFNIEKEAKGTGQAIVKSFTANVSDNTLEIHFQWAGKGTNVIPETNVYGPLVSAISVTPDFTPIIYDSLSNRKERKLSTGAILGLQGVELLTGYFTLRQIKAATRNFDAANKLGEEDTWPLICNARLLDGQSHVYSFGVVMLEIASGLSNTHLYKTSDDFIYLLDWILLKRQNLTGSLPDELANLTSLQSIDLTHNYLGGTIPVAWTSLPLITLSLLGNRISGSIPEELGNITTLNVLVLEDNLLQGSIPSGLGKLRNLEQLLLSANNLTGGLPKTLGNLKNLTHFEGNRLERK
ncbi:hypothetical protein J5N97_004638 [Dioscorea zingiberensis]|uniref:non-specific serine/threonine protein kinase n=1 Tax=Dioscorea zingiberensis TaxID=325984 RepID=A0A9D5HSD1_9LILI|nr:hypothetical protein J5N97_004638 [Dioscorea zingiberensis]